MPIKTKSRQTTGTPRDTYEMITNPDVVIEYQPEFCNHCGDDLIDEPAIFMLPRQFVDIH